MRRGIAVVLCTALLALASACGGGSPDERGSDWAPAPQTVGGLRTLARADADGFRLHTASGAKTFLPGMNLGGTVPLHQPGEIGDIPRSDYHRWLQQMGALGVRVVRIYTLPHRLTVSADVVPAVRGADYKVVLDRGAGTARLFVRRELDPIRLDTSMRPYRPDEKESWHLYELLTDRAYPHAPTGVLPAEYQRVGDLIEGSWDPRSRDYDSLATWRVDTGGSTVHLRLPWSMLGLADPSSRTALGTGEPARMVRVPGIDFELDADGDSAHLQFAWPTWNHTGYTERIKAGAGQLANAFAAVAP